MGYLFQDGRPPLRNRKWYARFKGLDGLEHKVALARERRSSERALTALEDAIERAGAGRPVAPEDLPTLVKDAFRKDLQRVAHPLLSVWEASRPLSEQIEEWGASMRAGGAGERHVTDRKRNARYLLGTDNMADVSLHRSQVLVNQLRARGRSPRTINAHVVAVRQFMRWMVANGRILADPLGELRRVRDPASTRRRRALSEDEVAALLRTTARQKRRAGLTGQERATLYRLAVETGLRFAELQSLASGDFDLGSSPATVTVRAAYAKNRREDVLPLRPGTVAELRLVLGRKHTSARAFPLPTSGPVLRALRRDLEAAGIAYEDEGSGRVDFHALRHTFVTRLARAGVHPRVAQDLARHSVITLTMKHYTHTVLEDRLAALDRLPDLPTPEQRQASSG